MGCSTSFSTASNRYGACTICPSAPKFKKPLAGAAWSASLERLALGGSLNQSLSGTSFPKHLLKLVLSLFLQKPVELVAWPRSLEGVTFCLCFDQPAARSAWPAALRKLPFGVDVSHPIAAERFGRYHVQVVIQPTARRGEVPSIAAADDVREEAQAAA